MKEHHARAFFLGSRIDLRAIEGAETVAIAPLTVRVGAAGYAMVFRFGAAVLFDIAEDEASAFLERLAPRVSGRLEEPETEDADIDVDPSRLERVEANGKLCLHDASVERLQVVAQVLAKSTLLAHYEERVAAVFDRIETLAEDLRRGASPARGRDLLREIGSVLLIQARTVGRAEVTEKPEITWDRPELDRLYERLAAEYELRDRDLALSRKLDLVASTAETYLDLLHNRQSIRVEWYIVLLILVEIVIILYDILVVR